MSTNYYYPPYVNDDGCTPCFPGPYMQEGAEVAALPIKSDIHKLRAVCDKYLNNLINDEEWRYIPIAPYSLLVYAKMQIYSLNPENVWGKMDETDLGFWIPVLACKKFGKYYIPRYFAFFLPTLFVDNPYAIITGRESFGFRKQQAQFVYPTEIQNPEFTASPLAFPQAGKEVEGQWDWLLQTKRINPFDRGAQPEINAQTATSANLFKLLFGENFLQETFDELQKVASHFELKIPNEINKLLDLKLKVPMVFLKQFRDIAQTDQACYQAVVEAPAELLKLDELGFLHGVYQLHINKLASHPVVEMLGLDVKDNGTEWVSEPTFGLWTKMDFSMNMGKEVYKVPPQKQKVAILGGGAGALSAALGLTETPNWQEKYDITVYQMGWRLGGKGASGRNAAMGQRIEEHGLHIWFGFYENAFRAMKLCYDEMNRTTDAPLNTWDQAFRPHNFITIKDFHNNQWKNWPLPFPPQPGIPGIGGRQFWPLTYVKKIVFSIIEHLPLLLAQTAVTKTTDELPSWIKALLTELPVAKELEHPALALASAISHLLDKFEDHQEMTAVQASTSEALEHLFAGNHEQFHLLAEAKNALLDQSSLRFMAIHYLLDKLLTLLKDFASSILDEVRWVWIVIQLGAVCAWGMLRDGIIFKGFDSIDNIDFRAWLLRNGAADYVAYSAPVRAFYDLAFAYPNGDTGSDEPSRAGDCAAGTTLHSILLILFAYKGSVMWKMQAGMGDVVFTPLYYTLKQRGVKFKFFHKITDLIPTEDGTAIDKIIFNRQVDLKEGIDEYKPLVTVKGLTSWPSEPLYAQIVQGNELQEQDINLESYWTPWQDVAPNLTLQKGIDFDIVVNGIPISASKLISKKLAEKSTSWKGMVDNVQSVCTQAMQLWLKPNLEETGWKLPSTVLDAYAQPFNTWADMSQTLRPEDWKNQPEPNNVAYFCGPLKDAEPDPIPPPEDHDFPEKITDQTYETGKQWLNANIGLLWPYLMKDGQFDWSCLNDPDEGIGEARFDSQYWRANVDPSERYSLSVSNTNQYKLKTDGSDFKNLFLAGDWVNNGFLNVGCVEATVISGLQAAEAISGCSLNIVY